MTDDLVARFVEQLRQAGGEAGVQCEDCLPLADAIDALRAARNKMALSSLKADGEADRAWEAQKAAEADNARLRERAKDVDWLLSGTPLYEKSGLGPRLRAALETGKEAT